MSGYDVSPDATCAHCQRPARGTARIGFDTWLCHPSEGLDCYRMVTIYKHSLDCGLCRLKRPELSGFAPIEGEGS